MLYCHVEYTFTGSIAASFKDEAVLCLMHCLQRGNAAAIVCINLIANAPHQSTLKYSSLYKTPLFICMLPGVYNTYMSGGSNWALVMLNPQHKCLSEQGSARGHGDGWRWAVRHPFRVGEGPGCCRVYFREVLFCLPLFERGLDGCTAVIVR